MLLVGCAVVMSFAYITIKLMISHVSLLVILSVHMGKLWLLLLLFLIVEWVNSFQMVHLRKDCSNILLNGFIVRDTSIFSRVHGVEFLFKFVQYDP